MVNVSVCTDEGEIQEISQMLAGQLSNQDEEEVEDELDALQRTTEGSVVLPNAPISTLPTEDEEEEERQERMAKQKAHSKKQAVLSTA